ncbi:MAG: biotin/lipoyl-binding protein [Gammaproteobacteria bacterium]|nr:biotin/lipoyl-binding protein [Gammaproteobacteria bacterium]
MNASVKPATRYLPTSERKKRIAVAAGFIMVAALASATIFATGPTATVEARTEKSWPVSVVTVSPRTLRPTFNGYGRVESSNVANIRTDLIAEVSEVLVREGDWVTQGQVLIRLANAEVSLRVAEREAELAERRARWRSIEIEYDLRKQTTSHYQSMQQVAQNKLNRHQELMEQRLISQALLDEVVSLANSATIAYQTHTRQLADFPNRLAAQRARIAKAQALLGQAQLDLTKTSVVAPFAGPVLSVQVAPGDRSNLGIPLVEVAQADGFEVRVQVPDSSADAFQRHLRAPTPAAEITATTASGLTMNLVRLSSRVRDGQSGLDAFFQLEVAAGERLPAIGRVIELEITMPAQENVVALPVQSIYQNNRIYEVVNERLNAIEVERIGELRTPTGDYRVLVRSPDLSDGQSVITTQLPKAITGLLVEAA